MAIEPKATAIFTRAPTRKQVADPAAFDPRAHKAVLCQQILQQGDRTAFVWGDRRAADQRCGQLNWINGGHNLSLLANTFALHTSNHAQYSTQRPRLRLSAHRDFRTHTAPQGRAFQPALPPKHHSGDPQP